MRLEPGRHVDRHLLRRRQCSHVRRLRNADDPRLARLDHGRQEELERWFPPMCSSLSTPARTRKWSPHCDKLPVSRRHTPAGPARHLRLRRRRRRPCHGRHRARDDSCHPGRPGRPRPTSWRRC